MCEWLKLPVHLYDMCNVLSIEVCSFTRLTLKVLVTTTDALMTTQWEGMGDVGSVRYEPTLLPPCPTIRVLSYSNCQRSTYSISK